VLLRMTLLSGLVNRGLVEGVSAIWSVNSGGHA